MRRRQLWGSSAGWWSVLSRGLWPGGSCQVRTLGALSLPSSWEWREPLWGVLVGVIGGSGATSFDVWSLLVAAAGAIALLYVYGLLARRTA
jgi:hypothetical protein